MDETGKTRVRCKGVGRSLAHLLALMAMLALPLAVRAACSMQAFELPVTMTGSRAITTVAINGNTVPLMIDSGAFYSYLSPAAARQLKLPLRPLPSYVRVQGLTGDVETRRTTVRQLGLQGGTLNDVDFLVGGSDIEGGALGLMGRNMLAISDIEYDLAHGMIRLMFLRGDCAKVALAYWAAGKPVSELELLPDEDVATPAISAFAQLNGEKVRVLFDTGATSLVTLSAARRAGVRDDELTDEGTVRGGGRGSAKAWNAAFARFAIGGEAISNVRVRVADSDALGYDMLLGIDFFLSHRIYVSKDRQRMYFTYNGGPVFALNAALQAGASAELPAADPSMDAAAYARRGAAAASRLNYPAALADLDRACALAPTVADYRLQRAKVRAAAQQADLALEDADVAIRLAPTLPEALLLRARLRNASGATDAALQDLTKLDGDLPPQAQQRLQLAELYRSVGRLDLALRQWNFWIAAHASDAALDDAFNARCWNRMLLGTELDKALDDCNAALQKQPDNGNYLDSRGWVQARRGALPQATRDFERALQANPGSAWSLYGRGSVRLRQGDVRNGQADIEAARKVRPNIDEEAAKHGLAVNPG